jgi:hypothetical protein
MSKREQNPRPVKYKYRQTWAPYYPNGRVYVGDKYAGKAKPQLTCGFVPVRVHIAPTATHAVVELAKVADLIRVSGDSKGSWDVGVMAALKHLGLLPAPKPKPSPGPRLIKSLRGLRDKLKPAKCKPCGGTGLVNSGVPSMPMPCPKCSKPAKKARKK